MRRWLLSPIATLVLAAAAPGARSAGPTPSAAPALALPMIEDDYPRALARAKAESLPLFVDAWAPW